MLARSDMALPFLWSIAHSTSLAKCLNYHRQGRRGRYDLLSRISLGWGQCQDRAGSFWEAGDKGGKLLALVIYRLIAKSFFPPGAEPFICKASRDRGLKA